VSKETYIRGKRGLQLLGIPEIRTGVNRDLEIDQLQSKRDLLCSKRDLLLYAKETHLEQKRPIK
jgi:hypothetical protein